MHLHKTVTYSGSSHTVRFNLSQQFKTIKNHKCRLRFRHWPQNMQRVNKSCDVNLKWYASLLNKWSVVEIWTFNNDLWHSLKAIGRSRQFLWLDFLCHSKNGACAAARCTSICLVDICDMFTAYCQMNYRAIFSVSSLKLCALTLNF